MARAIDWAIQRESATSGEFLAVNVGCEEWNFQVKDLAEAVAKVVPEVSISIDENAPPDKRSYRVCFDLFKKLAPEYQPQVDVMTTIKELKDGLDAMNFSDENFRTSEFMRLKVLNRLREQGLLSETLEWTNGLMD
jgi:nucleoside-diphosphate-sugar epimerase